MKTTLIMEIEHSKPIPDLADIAANRVWPLDGVTGVTAAIQEEAVFHLRSYGDVTEAQLLALTAPSRVEVQS